jgi:2-desacetyl-2-hydroxyethyl bacteriochlorophyllide A dehydrogenase
MAEFVIVPPENMFIVPDEVSDAQAVLVECLATPVHAARIAGDLHDASVLIIGAGTIGFFCLLAAQRAGAATIVVSDLDESKRDRAMRHGATSVVDPAATDDLPARVRELAGQPVDAVFDCVANEHSMRQAIASVRRSGSVLIVGVPAGDVTVPLTLVQDWELTVQGCANYTGDDIDTAITMAATGGLPAAEVITAEFGIEDAAAAFTQAAEFSSGKVVLRL